MKLADRTPLFESRFEFDWLKELAQRLGVEDFSEGCGSVRDWNRLLYERTQRKEPEKTKNRMKKLP